MYYCWDEYGDCHGDIDDMVLEGKGVNGDVNGDGIIYLINMAVFLLCVRESLWLAKEGDFLRLLSLAGDATNSIQITAVPIDC